MTLTIDIAVISTLIAVERGGGTVAGFIIAGYRVYRKFDDLPSRVAELEKVTRSCSAKRIDFDKLDETLEWIIGILQRVFSYVMEVINHIKINLEQLLFLQDYLERIQD